MRTDFGVLLLVSVFVLIRGKAISQTGEFYLLRYNERFTRPHDTTPGDFYNHIKNLRVGRNTKSYLSIG